MPPPLLWSEVGHWSQPASYAGNAIDQVHLTQLIAPTQVHALQCEAKSVKRLMEGWRRTLRAVEPGRQLSYAARPPRYGKESPRVPGGW
jgi:hypothetical protein